MRMENVKNAPQHDCCILTLTAKRQSQREDED